MTNQEILNKYHYHRLNLEHKKILDKSKVGYGLGKKLLSASAALGAAGIAAATGYNIADHLDLSHGAQAAAAIAPAYAAGFGTAIPLSNRLRGRYKIPGHTISKRWHERQMRKIEHEARLRGLKLE